jgi:hypothetical protein
LHWSKHSPTSGHDILSVEYASIQVQEPMKHSKTERPNNSQVRERKADYLIECQVETIPENKCSAHPNRILDILRLTENFEYERSIPWAPTNH